MTYYDPDYADSRAIKLESKFRRDHEEVNVVGLFPRSGFVLLVTITTNLINTDGGGTINSLHPCESPQKNDKNMGSRTQTI